jgi:phosphatidic acid-selective phospholipase A1
MNLNIVDIYQITIHHNSSHLLFRITGLDPAKWKFFPAVYENPLGKNDAIFVDTIQTDNFFVGAIVPLGHASFYPNNAEVQPGCPPLRTNSFYDFISCK